MKDYIELMIEHCTKCDDECPECTEMECNSVNECFKAFYPRKERKLLN